ncbi:MAG: cyclic nucleotide-gated ion channel [Thermoanaerobaculia bacterium]|nr:cyclic nucleotide-gated ion channel [Thermoanaerobaculia bacterium]
MTATPRAVKNRVWELLEPPAKGDRASHQWDLLVIGAVLASVTGRVLVTLPTLTPDQRELLAAVEAVTVALFGLEVLGRVWVADLARPGEPLPRLRYLTSPMGIVDWVAVTPLPLTLLFPRWETALAVLALLRILKLVRYSPALRTLYRVVLNERRVLEGAATVMLVLLLFSSTVVFLVERQIQPEAFGSIPAAMWWGIATLTTVGYGDVTPLTPLGRLFGAVVTLLGIGMFALPAGILSSGFAREIKQQRFIRTLELVGAVPLFESLNAHDVARVARRLDPLVVQAGQVVVREGEEATSMFFVATGELEVDVRGRRERLASDFFGEIALLEKGTRTATIRTLTRCQLLALEQSHFEELLDENPGIERAVRRAARTRRERDARRRATERTRDA